MNANRIRFVEELAANAWPAAIVQHVDGWRFRFNWGITRRANSVWPNYAKNRYPLETRLAMVEDFYARWGGPARFQMCPAAQPENLDEILANRGYIIKSPTEVQSAPTALVLARTKPQVEHTVSTTHTFTSEWFNLYCQAEMLDDHAAQARKNILQRIAPATAFVLLKIDDEPASVGLGISEQGWTGVFSMATAPRFRRQGAATSILHALARWSIQNSAEQMYLQVMDNNPQALGLYGQVGFERFYRYYYREIAT
jgi:ribosomal protein S18 acetylase RimI-like enzyme